MGRSYNSGTYTDFPLFLKVGIGAPLDNRLVVDELDDLLTLSPVYVGIVVYVKESPHSLWVLIDEDSTNIENWHEFRDITCNTVETKSDLTSIERAYVGMVVYVKNVDVNDEDDEDSDKRGHSLWVLIDEDSTNIENWHEFKDWETTQSEFPVEEMVQELKDQIEELKDWVDALKVSQTRVREDESGTLQFIYDKEEPRSDSIIFDEDNKSLVIEPADPSNWSRKILIYDEPNSVMRIIEDK